MILCLIIFILTISSAVPIPLDVIYRSSISFPLKNAYDLSEKLILPDYMKPIQYTVNVSLALDQPTKALEPFSFAGQMVVVLELTKPSRFLAFNVKELQLNTDLRSYMVQTIDSATRYFNVTAMAVSRELDLVNFTVSRELRPGKYSFSFGHYSGRIAPDKERDYGLYYSPYFTSSGIKRFVASTQFEAFGARYVFPCVDQPNAKAKWNVHASVSIPNRMILNGQHDHHTSVSHTEVPQMSSYLVAIAAGDFASKEHYFTSINGSRLAIKTWARPDVIEQTVWGLECASKATQFFERAFKMTFVNELEFFNMVSVPVHVSAMENWALVIFGEAHFLFDENRDDFDQRKHVCIVVAHEISHHWFGNLVTMADWGNVFLNEGFASLMGFEALSATVNSSVDGDAEFVRTQMSKAFEVDASVTSPPLRGSHVREITYCKGGSVFRMFKYVLGGFDNFAEALGVYVNKFRYRNVEYTDLLHVLSEYHKNFTNGNTSVDFMKFGLSWIEQPGYPVVSIDRLNKTHVHLSQKRFLRQDDEPKSPSKEKWFIPIWYQVDGVDKDIVWLNEESMVLGIYDNQNFLIDPHTYGFYRVKYSAEILNQIGDQLKKNHSSIKPRARVRVLDDTFHMAEASLVPHKTALELSSYVINESDYLPAITVLKYLDRLQVQFLDSSSVQADRDNANEDPIEEYKENLLDKLKGQGESFAENELSKVIAEELRKTQHNATIVKDIAMFREEFFKPCNDDFLPKNGCSRVPYPLRRYVYCEGVKHGELQEFELVLRMYQKEYMSATEKHSLLNALTCAQNETQLKWLLNEATKNNGEFNIVDSTRIFHLISLNRPVGKTLLFDWVLENWKDVCYRFKDKLGELRKIMGASLSDSSNHAIRKLEKFIEYPIVGPHLRALESQLNRLKKKRDFVVRTSSSLFEWFSKQKY